MERVPIVVAREALASGKPGKIVTSNCIFLCELREALFRDEELSPAALQSEAVEWYLGQCLNGGFSQYLYNAQGHPERIDLTRAGLLAIGAARHLELFDRLILAAERLGGSRLRRFFTSGYFGRNPDRDALNRGDDEFQALLETEDLSELNGRWLAGQPGLIALPQAEFSRKVAELAAALITDQPARRAAALAAEPRFLKLIRALAAAAGHEYLRTTTGDPTYEFEGRQTLGWNFFTDRGRYVMVDLKKTAVMLDYPDGRVVTTIPAKGVK